MLIEPFLLMEHSSLYSVSSRVSFEPTETDLKTSSSAFHQDGSSSSNLMEAEEYEAWLVSKIYWYCGNSLACFNVSISLILINDR